MVALTATISAVTVIAGGLFALCATVFATAGWTAPACLAAGVASGIDLILSIVSDATSGDTKSGANDPDTRKREANKVQKFFKMHDDGWMENYDGRLHELYGSNETHTIVDAKRGHTHTFKMNGDRVSVNTDFTRGTCNAGLCRKKARQAQSAKLRKFGRRGANAAIETRDSQSMTLSSANYEAQKVGTRVDTPDDSSADALGAEVANAAYQIGTYCVSINDPDGVVADIGLTYSSPGHYATEFEPPCQAS